MDLPGEPIMVRTHCSPDDRNARKKARANTPVDKGHLGPVWRYLERSSGCPGKNIAVLVKGVAM